DAARRRRAEPAPRARRAPRRARRRHRRVPPRRGGSRRQGSDRTTRRTPHLGGYEMRFHLPSFLLRVAGSLTIRTIGPPVRPVAVEIAATCVHLLNVSRAIIERRREDGEDLWAEIQERVRQRARGTNGAAEARRPAPRPSAEAS